MPLIPVPINDMPTTESPDRILEPTIADAPTESITGGIVTVVDLEADTVDSTTVVDVEDLQLDADTEDSITIADVKDNTLYTEES
jgi:hypothetical protein